MDTKVADPLHGALLGGRYRIMGRLARGGMATVYQARDERLERPVAVKIIHPDHARDPQLLDRLADEAKTVARLGHPNIVAVFDQGTHEGSPYLVMEYVRGRTLRAVLDDRRRLDPSESLAILEQMLAALAVAHRAGLVHRDVKPENVLIAAPPNGSGDLVDAVVKVADFGLAHAVEISGRHTGGGDLLATAEYVAPELVADGRADPRADVYSTGIVLFEMLTGRVPFEGDQSADVAWQHVDHDVPAPSKVVPGLPKLLDDVVARATAREPSGRPRDAAALLAEVQAAREDVGALAGPTRALAHPTVIVAPVTPSARFDQRPDQHSRTDRDPRPSWARLPGPRGPVTVTPGLVSTARRRVVELVPSRPLRGALSSVAGLGDRLRGSAQGRRQLTALFVVMGILLMVGGWWLGFGRYTEAPKLVEFTKANAVAEATRLGFTVEFGTGRYDEHVPIDTVLTQSPSPGGRIVKGGAVTVFLSLGPERYQVPEVAGQAVDFATAQVKTAHFVVQTKDGYSDTLPPNFVAGTEPENGRWLPPNSVVTLIVVKGPYPAHVPSVVGKQRDEAESTLKSQGFTVEIQEKDDPTQKKGQVLDQNPPGGQGLASADGAKVTLVVAKGPPGVPMPRVLDAGCNDARNTLQGLGLQVDVQGNDIEKALGRVKQQNPQPDEQVQTGQQVQIQCGVLDRPIGAHATVAGGLAKGSLPYVDATGAQAVQVFVSNPRGWALTDGDPRQDELFVAGCADRGIPAFIHASYLVNLGSPTAATVQRSTETLAHGLLRGAQIGVAGVVFHAGSAVDEHYAPTALGQVREALLPLLDATLARGGPRLLVEPTAGGGRCLAARVEDLAAYFEAVQWHPGLGVCFDTCHVWAAGHDLASPGGMTATLDLLVDTVGPGRLALVHANDSKDACGSLRDRHETIGAGSIGEAGFAELLRHPATLGIPVVVETPSEGHAGHAADIATLIRLAAAPKTPKPAKAARARRPVAAR